MVWKGRYRMAGFERSDENLRRAERWTEIPLLILSIAFIPTFLVPRLFSVSNNTEDSLDTVSYVIWAMFAMDLISKTVIAPNRLAYLKRHWFDVVIVALPFIRPLSIFRSVRGFQLFRLVRAVALLARMQHGFGQVLSRNGLRYILACAMVIVVVAAALVTTVEREASDTNIRTFSDGLWWAIVTVTTVGYGDRFPVTGVGRGIGVFLMVLGISLFGIVTASVASYFVSAQEHDHQARMEAKIDNLTALIAELVEQQRRSV
jgi:voltage-gated potassium channel